MKVAVWFAALAVAVFSSVLADEPPAPAARAAAAPSSSAPSAVAASAESKPAAAVPAATTAAAPPTADKSQLVNVAATEALIQQMRGRGYKPVNRNGTLVFCRSEGEIGTHFARTRCSTIEDLKAAELTGKEYVNSIQQQPTAAAKVP